MATTTTKTAAKKIADAATETAAEIETNARDVASEAADVMSFSSASAADWAKNAQEQFEAMMSSFTGNFDDMRAQAEDLSETAQARIKAAQDHAAKTNARLMEAAQEEMTSAVQFASDLGKAKTFADALSVQQTYWTKLFETRMAHARELTERSVEAARETMTPVETPFANMKALEKFFAFPLKA